MGRAARLPLLALPGPRGKAAAEAALARLGVGHLADRPVTEPSGGERQLVLVARALAQEAAALVMDEPTASLDFGNRTLVPRQVPALAGRGGLAVLMTTHHPDHAFLVADDAALLHRGALSGPAAPEALATPPCCARLTGWRRWSAPWNPRRPAPRLRPAGVRLRPVAGTLR